MSDILISHRGEQQRVVFVELIREELAHVITERPTRHGTAWEEYVFNWCRRDGCYYWENTGGGGGEAEWTAYDDYWAAEGLAVKEHGERARRLPAIPAKIEAALPAMFDGSGWDRDALHGSESATHWCEDCLDNIPCDSASWCAHMWYCENGDGYSSYGEPCGCCWVCQVCREFVSHAYDAGWNRAEIEGRRRERRERDEDDCTRCECGAARFYAHLAGPWPRTTPGRWVQCHTAPQHVYRPLQWRLQWHQEERRRRAAA